MGGLHTLLSTKFWGRRNIQSETLATSSFSLEFRDGHGQSLVRPMLLRFGNKEQVMFSKRLAMILRSGVPVVDALSMLNDAHNSRSAAFIFARIIEDVSRGEKLSSSLSTFGSTFGAFTVHIVQVGEVSGTLHQNLEYLSEELKKKEILKKRVIGALIYPAVIVCATVGISMVLTMYIFPKIIPIFQSFKHTIPLTTRILIAASGFLIRYGWFLLIGLIAFSITFFFLLRNDRIHRILEQFVFRTPIFGKLSCYYNLANITRMTSILLKGDMRFVHALEIVAGSTSNMLYGDELKKAAAHVMRGRTLSTYLRASPKLFPPLCTQMISAGEGTGNLPESLMYLSEMYEEELNDLIRNLTTLLEPILMVVMGVIVGFIAISIITPIYGITQNLTPH